MVAVFPNLAAALTVICSGREVGLLARANVAGCSCVSLVTLFAPLSLSRSDCDNKVTRVSGSPTL